ncbi:TetR/AcrR family transcriptional regulator [Dysgonomonas termitidis]|uniref:TetR/AcrR family transcriptional regulator n=1 Tax=Dysgonomonas termitidis TaxID=1516126 RepID=A0ABV9L217_9BACT
MKKTKDKILFETFKLLVQSSYERTTFDEIEKITGVTRGAISYHFKTKENLFMAVIEEFVFKRGSILQIPVRDTEKFILKNFIGNFIEHCYEENQRVNNLGITNFNLAYFNIELQALFFYPNFINKVLQWLEIENKVWEDIIKAAIENNEISENVDIKRLASIFVKSYLGDSYIGIFHKNGQDLEELKKDFMHIYDLIKLK